MTTDADSAEGNDTVRLHIGFTLGQKHDRKISSATWDNLENGSRC